MGRGKSTERGFVGLWAAGCPPFALEQEAYLRTIGKISAPQKEISGTKGLVSVGVEVERGLVAREINCVSNDASNRSL